MEFRRTGQRDDRRRRVMLDERLGSGDRTEQRLKLRRGGDTSSDRSIDAPSYHDAARADQQKRITDLIPTRPEILFIFALAAVTAITGLEALYGQYEVLGRNLGEANVTALDPIRPASLAGWFSSLVLAVCSVAALLVYTIRRHKEDDYRGRYRIWVWAAIVWLLGSMTAAAPTHDLVAGAIACVSGSQLTGNPAVFSTSFYAMVLVTVVVPVLVDIRQSSLALTAFLASGAAYLLAAAIDLQLLIPLAGPFRTMCLSTARMGSHVLLLLSLLLFARHVYLDAQGALSTRRVRPRRRKSVKTSRTTEVQDLRVVSDDLGEMIAKPSRVDRDQNSSKSSPDDGTPAKTTRRRRRVLKPAASAEPEEQVVKVPTIRRKKKAEPEDEFADEIARLEAIEPHLLTKAQRRRLRKLKKRAPRKAA
jgi:hypothetical protein